MCVELLINMIIFVDEREEESSPRKIKKNNRNSYHEEYFSGSDIDEDHNYSQPSINHNKVRSTHEHNKLNKQQPHKMNPPSKSSFQRNRNHYQSRDDEDHDDDDDEEHEHSNNNNRGGIAKDKSRFVSIEEYDELSKLCDSLLSQQEQLQSELKNQASMLKVRLSFHYISISTLIIYRTNVYECLYIYDSLYYILI